MTRPAPSGKPIYPNFCADLQRQGVALGRAVPSVIVWAWRLGIDVPPPIYWRTRAVLTVLGGAGALLLFPVLLSVDVFLRENVAPWWYYVASSVLLGGVLAGGALWAPRWALRGRTLKRWEDYRSAA